VRCLAAKKNEMMMHMGCCSTYDMIAYSIFFVHSERDSSNIQNCRVDSTHREARESLQDYRVQQRVYIKAYTECTQQSSVLICTIQVSYTVIQRTYTIYPECGHILVVHCIVRSYHSIFTGYFKKIV